MLARQDEAVWAISMAAFERSLSFRPLMVEGENCIMAATFKSFGSYPEPCTAKTPFKSVLNVLAPSAFEISSPPVLPEAW